MVGVTWCTPAGVAGAYPTPGHFGRSGGGLCLLRTATAPVAIPHFLFFVLFCFSFHSRLLLRRCCFRRHTAAALGVPTGGKIIMTTFYGHQMVIQQWAAHLARTGLLKHTLFIASTSSDCLALKGIAPCYTHTARPRAR